MKNLLILITILTLFTLLITLSTCSDDSSTTPGSYAGLTDSEKEQVVNMSTTMIYTSISQGMSEAFAGMGGGTGLDNINLAWTCDSLGCSGSTTINGTNGGSATISGSFSGSADIFTIDLTIDYVSYSNYANWSITGNLDIDGDFSSTGGTLNYSGTITTNAGSLGTYTCDIDVTYSYTASAITVSGSWCGDSVEYDFTFTY